MPSFTRMITTIDSHTAGECTRLVTSGLPPLLGGTMVEKLAHADDHLGWVPGFLLLEPRGHRDMFGAILTAPCKPEGDIGLIFMDNQGYEPMCGHAVIGAVTTVLEIGMLVRRGSESIVVLDTPSGLVRARACWEDGRVRSVSFRNVPAFVYRSDVMLDVPDLGELTVDVVFGGLFFVFVTAAQIGLDLVPRNARYLAEAGMRILAVANDVVKVRHPELPHIDRIIDVRFYTEPGMGAAGSRNVVILGDHMVDRSPCGTGTSAEAALRHSRGRLGVGGSFTTESIIGTQFQGRVVAETKVGDFPAVVPEITGSAHVTGFHRFLFEPEDPFPEGFVIERVGDGTTRPRCD